MGWPSLLLLLCGDALVIIALSFIFSLRTWRSILSLKGPQPSATPLSLIEQSGIVLGFGVLLAVSLSFPIPRYFAIIIPILMISLTVSVFDLFGKRLAAFFLAVAIGINVINWNGSLLISMESVPILKDLVAWSAFRERSREYLNLDLSLHKAIDALQSSVNQDSIVITHAPLGTLLSVPELGYVKSPLHGYSTNTNSTIQKKFVDLKENSELIKKMLETNRSIPVFVIGWQIPFTVTKPEDKIIYHDPSYNIVVYQRELHSDDDMLNVTY